MSKEDRKARFRQQMKQTAEENGTHQVNGHPGEGDELSRLATTRLDGVKPRSVRWLVSSYIPLGKLVLLAGDGGHGKSLITLHVVACLTTGRPCFGLEYDAPPACEALIVCCEDDYADTVVPRLIAASADLGKVYSVDGVKSKDGKPSPFSLAHYEALEKELELRPNVRLVVIDPAGAYIGRSGIDDHKDSELRALLGPLAELAARRDVTIIIVKHLTKGVAAKAVHKVSGSAGYVNSVRAAFVVAPDVEEEGKRFFLPIKFNIGPKLVGLAYRLEGLPTEEQEAALDGFQLEDEDRQRLAEQLVRVRWLGLADVDADTVLAASARQERGPSRVEACAAWLKRFLGECAWPDDEVKAECLKAGFTFHNFRDAKKKLKDAGLRSKPHGFQRDWWIGFGDPTTMPQRPESRSGETGQTSETSKTEPQSGQSGQCGQSDPSGQCGQTDGYCPDDDEAAERAAIEAEGRNEHERQQA